MIQTSGIHKAEDKITKFSLGGSSITTLKFHAQLL